MAGKKLLVADDSLTIQKVIRLALSNESYEIQAVADGNDAIQQISVYRPDIVLIDVSLPGKSAFEVKREINELGDLDEVRFILMSSAFEKVDEVLAEEVKFHGRLTKPFDPAHLRQVLVEVLAQVTAKRMEKTSFIQRPSAVPPAPPEFSPPPLPSFSPPPPPFSKPGQSDRLWESEADEFQAPIAPPSDFPPEFSPELPPELPPFSMEPPSFSPPMPPGTPPPAPIQFEDSDIKHLTDSTMKISGFDDEWNINEPQAKPPFPREDDERINQNLPPLYGSQDYPPSNDLPQFDQEDNSYQELPLAPPNFPPFQESTEASGFPLPPSDLPGFSEQEIPVNLPPKAPPRLESKTFSDDQIEEMVKKQVEAALVKMAQTIVPEVAERIIKQEIHRLLSEPK